VSAPLGLHGVLPRSLLAGRCLLVLVAYLDDSGKDSQNPITTLGGFAGTDDGWRDFENAVEPIFGSYGVPILHATDLHKTEGVFKGWTVLKKQSFIAQISREMNGRLILGVSISAHKDTYKMRAEESDRKRTVTPYTFCLNVIVDWLLRDYRTGKTAWSQGIALVVECGNEHNAEAEQSFHEIVKEHHLSDVLRSISFVPKKHCRAIQMADLIAFYSRRDGVARVKAGIERWNKVEPDIMLKIMLEGIQHRTFIAIDFGPDAPKPPLFGEWP
jgi:uncharacterized protein DUF3800